MATQPSSASAMAWAWALEAMASFREIDASTILELFLKSPMISNDTGENAREAVSFRVLENLFALETTITEPVFLASNPKDGFGLSDHCEDVLLQILKKGESEKLKWDAFIMHKRSHLPKCVLRKLNDAILEDKYPSLAFLKQRSGVVISSQFETRIHRSDGDCNQSTWGVQGTNTNAQITSSSCCTYPYKKPKLSSRVPQPAEDKFGTNNECEGQKRPILYHVTTDGYQKEMSCIATKKQDFLNYICKGRGDRSSTTYWKEANLCMKCENGCGDQLLACSSDACPFVFHDSCLVSTTIPSDKTMLNFYCPFCRYSHSVVKFHVAGEKASLARNDMLVFSGLGMNQRQRVMVKR